MGLATTRHRLYSVGTSILSGRASQKTQDQESVPDDDQESVLDDDQESVLDDDQESVPDDDQESVPDDDQEFVPDDDQESVPDDDQESVPDDDQESVPDDDQESVPDDDQESVSDRDDALIDYRHIACWTSDEPWDDYHNSYFGPLHHCSSGLAITWHTGAPLWPSAILILDYTEQRGNCRLYEGSDYKDGPYNPSLKARTLLESIRISRSLTGRNHDE